jgi:hypothetical protein
MTLVSALVLRNALMTLIFIIIQSCSYVWYMASYIPWGRDCLAGCLKKCSLCANCC